MLVNNILINTETIIADKPKATIIITHGIAEHSLYYKQTALKFKKSGYNVVLYDLRGHGRSQGRRGDVKNYSDFIDDLAGLVAYAKAELNTEVYLLGHSLGAVITALYGCMYDDDDVAGIILSATTLHTPKPLNVFKLFGYRLFGRKKIKTNFDDPMLSHLPKPFDVDPYALDYFRLRLAGQVLITGLKFLNKNLDKFILPALLLHGKEDLIVSYKNSEELYERIASEDKTLKLYPNTKHNLFNETLTDEVIEDIVSWIDERE